MLGISNEYFVNLRYQTEKKKVNWENKAIHYSTSFILLTLVLNNSRLKSAQN